jgi:hypothetical protein
MGATLSSPDMDVPSLGCGVPAASPDACALLCATLSGCAAWVYRAPSAASCPASCALKASWGDLMPASMGEVMAARMGAPLYVRWPNTSFSGGMLVPAPGQPASYSGCNTPAPSADACAARCAATTSCT